MKMKNVKWKIKNAMTVALALILNSQFSILNSSAAVPLKWTVETSRATPAQFEAYQGETLDLEATLQSYGKPLEASGIAALYWQTNGMGSAYWEASAAVNSNRLSAVWTPEMDVGAKVYNCFIGQPGTIYHAAFQLRLRPSPGATPNVLPLPVKTLDFSKVVVLNPPYYTKDETDTRISNATNALRRVDGAARTLPKYLWRYDSFDSYEKDAYWYYDREDASFSHRDPGMCSARRVGANLERNYDWYRDNAAEFVVLTEPGPGRFASVGIANIGERLTEEFVTSGAPSLFYKCLPGRTVDGVNSEGVAIEVNVVVTNGSPWETHVDGDGRDIDSRWAVRFVLDNAASAGWAASNLASRVYLSKAMRARGYSVHYAIVDRESTWLVEDGKALVRPANWPLVMTNFRLDTTPSRILSNDPYGVGYERYFMLTNSAVSLTNAWYSNAYRRNASGDFPWPTEFAGSVDAEGPIPNDATSRLQAWAKANIPAAVPDAAFPRGAGLWQTVHCSVYNLTNLTLRVAVQETDDWYTFQVPSAGGAKIDAYTKAETDEMLAGKLDREEAEYTYVPFSGAEYDVDLNGNGLSAGSVSADELYGSSLGVDGDAMISGDATVAGSVVAGGDVTTDSGDSLKSKANRPEDFDQSHEDYVAFFDSDGNLKDGGVAKTDIVTESEIGTRLGLKLDKADVIDPASATTTGKAADALKVNETLAGKQDALNSAQTNAVNSGITAAKVSTYDGYATSKADKSTTYTKSEVDTELGKKVAAYTEIVGDNTTMQEIAGPGRTYGPLKMNKVVGQYSYWLNIPTDTAFVMVSCSIGSQTANYGIWFGERYDPENPPTRPPDTPIELQRVGTSNVYKSFDDTFNFIFSPGGEVVRESVAPKAVELYNPVEALNGALDAANTNEAVRAATGTNIMSIVSGHPALSGEIETIARPLFETAKGAADAAQDSADASQDSADAAQSAAESAQDAADAAQATADAALPSSHPYGNVYGSWGYDDYSGNYGLKIYGSGDSGVWLTPYDVVWYSGGPYSTRLSLLGLSDEISYLYSDYHSLSDDLWSHVYNYYGSNPHGVTASDVGAPTYEEVDSMIGEITPDSIGAATPQDIDSEISATKTHFRDQVLSVCMNIDPTAAAEINRILERGSFESNCTVVVKHVLLNNADVSRMIVESAKLYYDQGLGVTWQVDVTNGCFYSHIVSDDNLVNNIH